MLGAEHHREGKIGGHLMWEEIYELSAPNLNTMTIRVSKLFPGSVQVESEHLGDLVWLVKR